MKKPEDMGLGWVLAAAFAVAVLVGVGLRGPVAKARERGRRASCAGSLHSMSLLLHMYSMDHDENFPENMDLLRPYGNAPKLFVCKSGGHVAAGSLTNVHAWGSYAYVSGHTESSRPDAVHVLCPPENHDGEGGNVLFIDGSVCWMDAASFAALMRSPDFYGGSPATNHVILWPTNHFP